MTEEKHENAWRIPSRTWPGEYGVLVRCGSDYPYWWLLCPADATLYIGEHADLRNCHMGMSCDHDDVHEDAERLRNRLVEVSRDSR